MKNSIITFFLILLFASTIVYGQTNYGRLYATDFITIGAGGGGKLTFPVYDPPTQFKNRYILGYNFGLDVMFPINSMLSTGVSVGMDSRSAGLVDKLESSYTLTNNLSYLSIFPFLKISTLVVGVNIGLPNKSIFENKIPIIGDSSYELNSDEMKDVEMMIEPRLGACAPLIDEEYGWLGLTFSVGYCTNKIYKSEPASNYMKAVQASKLYDGNLASANLGLTWQFRIPGYQRSRAK